MAALALQPGQLSSLARFGPQATFGISLLTGDYDYETSNQLGSPSLSGDANWLELELDLINQGGGALGFELSYMPEVDGIGATAFDVAFNFGGQLQWERFQLPIRVGWMIDYTDFSGSGFSGPADEQDVTFGVLLRTGPEVAIVANERYRWTAGCGVEGGIGLTLISRSSTDYDSTSTWIEFQPFTRVQWQTFFVELGYLNRSFRIDDAEDETSFFPTQYDKTERTLSGVILGAGFRF